MPELEWKKSNFGGGHSLVAFPEPGLEYAIDVLANGTEVNLNVTTQGESIHYEEVTDIEDGKRKAVKHYHDLCG